MNGTSGILGFTFNGTTDATLTAASTYTSDWLTGLDGMTALTAQLRFAYGGGGGAGSAYLQTSIDQGATAIDIACVSFTVTAKTVLLNVSGLTPKTTQVTPTDGALAADTALDGILGDRLRLKIVTTGPAYAGPTVFSSRVAVR
jgi:hypothetical protein